MELELISQRISQFLPVVDSSTETQRASRTGSGDYIPCVGTIWEDDFTREVIHEWSEAIPDELPNYSQDWLEIRYPDHRGKCDLCIRGEGYSSDFGEPPFEWAIEMKYVRFIGDNGKNNDYGVTKVASPYRKDRSSVLDAERLKGFDLASRKAIVMYGFEFDSESYSHAIDWCDKLSPDADKRKNRQRAENMHGVLQKEDPLTHKMELSSLIQLFEAAAGTRGIKLSETAQHTFDGLNRHPLYRKGRILAWEIKV